MESKTLSLTEQIYGELVDGLKTGLDWTQFLAQHGASKGPLYNAIGRFFNDMEPKARALSEVQASLDQAGIRLDSLDRQIKEAEGNVAQLEGKENTLNKQIETLETKLAEKNELLEYARELGKLSFDIERLRQLREALTEIGAKYGLKGKEAVSKFFHTLKDYEAILGAESQLKELQTQIETRRQELDKAEKKLEKVQKGITDLRKTLATYRRLEAIGFDEKALGELAKAAEKYGPPGKVLRAINRFADLSNIKAIDDGLTKKVRQKRQMIKNLDEQYSHLREPIELCKKLLKRRFGLRSLQLINSTAWRYGEPTEVMKAIEAYGALKEIGRETDQAKTALAEIKGKVEAEKETYAEYSARNEAMLDQLEALNAKALEVGTTVGSIQEQMKKDTMARDLLNLLRNPVSASYEEYSPLALVLLKSISVWANINKDKFRFPSLVGKNLKELTGYLGGG
ncbi:Chromosome partition protein Smc [subsurface metagenome]